METLQKPSKTAHELEKYVHSVKYEKIFKNIQSCRTFIEKRTVAYSLGAPQLG